MQQSGLDCQTVLVPCCGCKVDLLPAFLSRVVPLPGTRLLTHRSSAPFSFAVCGSSSSRVCQCGRPLDSSGHHGAACVVAGLLGSRGFVLESAAARACRIQDMDIVAPNQLDERRSEVLDDGLPVFHGAQVAVDTTLGSALRRDGTPRPRCADVHGAALEGTRKCFLLSCGSM